MKTKLIAVEIPVKYKWRSIDADGERRIYIKEPRQAPRSMRNHADYWLSHDGSESMSLGFGDKPKNWRDTLEKIVEIEWSE